MSDIHVNIYEGSAFEGRIDLIEQSDGTYRLDHPKADPCRIFIKTDNINEMVLFALMHLNTRE
jgi:hypothetical protein